MTKVPIKLLFVEDEATSQLNTKTLCHWEYKLENVIGEAPLWDGELTKNSWLWRLNRFLKIWAFLKGF